MEGSRVSKPAKDKKFEFFLAASHQLKSPVAIMQWCLQSVLERGEASARDLEMVRKAIVQANAMSQLITDMLHVFRLQDQQRAKSFTRVELVSLISEVFAQYEPVAHRQGVRLLHGPMEHSFTLADPSYLKQAIINLVDNAIKYTAEGGAITVSMAHDADEVRISVTDQGIGISPAEQEQLFHEFFRGQEARAVAHEGTGLGLVLVKHIAEEFGGTVTLHSELGKGSTFVLMLPKA